MQNCFISSYTTNFHVLAIWMGWGPAGMGASYRNLARLKLSNIKLSVADHPHNSLKLPI